MKEIFISHSSRQKDFANELRNQIGPNRCIIDCADFEAGKKSADEITRWFNESSIFVLLISREALASDWVSHEIELAKNRFYSPARKNSVFCPILIDSTLTHASVEIPKWIREEECFNLKLFKSPAIASHLILKAYRELIWKKDEKLMLHDTLFVGRKTELAEFEKETKGKVHPNLNGAVITGRPGVGKRSFARQCIISELKESPAFEPYKLTMGRKDDIENFLLQLNDFLQHPKDLIENILSSTKEVKLNKTVEFANELFSHRAYLFITDDMGCIAYNGKLTDWFRDFITHPDLKKELKIFVLSQVQWNSYEARKHTNLINLHLTLQPKDERIMLFNRCCEVFEAAPIRDEEVRRLVGKLHSPGQIINMAKEIKDHPFSYKRILDDMIKEGDNSILKIINPFLKDDLCISILLVLSKFEFLSHRMLIAIFSEERDDMERSVYEMINYNIIEEFGASDSYVRLDSAIADYIQRSKFKLNREMSRVVEEISENHIQNRTEIDDMSSYLIDQRQILEHQINGEERLKILIPSVGVKYVITLYDEGKYDNVVSICKRLLGDMHNFYPKITRELRYWMALCYARKNDWKELTSTVDRLNPADRNFIMGFYYRKAGNYDKALECLENANVHSPDTNKVRRELVEVHLRMGNIEDALELSRINYERRPDNAFHIQAYFQCLNAKPVRTREDIAIQKSLISEMKANNGKSAPSMLADMQRQFRD